MFRDPLHEKGSALLLHLCALFCLTVSAAASDPSVCEGLNSTECASVEDNACQFAWNACRANCSMYSNNVSWCNNAPHCAVLPNETCVMRCESITLAEGDECTANLTHCVDPPADFLSTTQWKQRSCLPRCELFVGSTRECSFGNGPCILNAFPNGTTTCELNCLYRSRTDATACSGSGEGNLKCGLLSFLSMDQNQTREVVCASDCSKFATDVPGATAASYGCTPAEGDETTLQPSCSSRKQQYGWCQADSCEPITVLNKADCVTNCSIFSSRDDCDIRSECKWTNGECVKSCSQYSGENCTSAPSGQCLPNGGGRCLPNCPAMDAAECSNEALCVQLNSSSCANKCAPLVDSLCESASHCEVAPGDKCIIRCESLTNGKCTSDPMCEMRGGTCTARCDAYHKVFGQCPSGSCIAVDRNVSSSEDDPHFSDCIVNCTTLSQSECKPSSVGGRICVWDAGVCRTTCASFRFGPDCPTTLSPDRSYVCTHNPVSGACVEACDRVSTSRTCSILDGCVPKYQSSRYVGCVDDCQRLSIDVASTVSAEEQKRWLSSLCTGTCAPSPSGEACVEHCAARRDSTSCGGTGECIWVRDTCRTSCRPKYLNCNDYADCSSAQGFTSCSTNCSYGSLSEKACSGLGCHWNTATGDCQGTCTDYQNASECPSHCHAEPGSVMPCQDGDCYSITTQGRCEDRSRTLSGIACQWGTDNSCFPHVCSLLGEARCRAAPDRCVYLNDAGRCIEACNLTKNSCINRRRLACKEMNYAGKDVCSSEAGCRVDSHGTCTFNCSLATTGNLCVVAKCLWANERCVLPCEGETTQTACNDRSSECVFAGDSCVVKCSMYDGDATRCNKFTRSNCWYAESSATCQHLCETLYSVTACASLGGTDCQWSSGECIARCSAMPSRATCEEQPLCEYHDSTGCIESCTSGIGSCQFGGGEVCRTSLAGACSRRCEVFPAKACGDLACAIDPTNTSRCASRCMSYDSTAGLCPAPRCANKVYWRSEDGTSELSGCRPTCSAAVTQEVCLSEAHCVWVAGTGCVDNCRHQNCTKFAYCKQTIDTGFDLCRHDCALVDVASCGSRYPYRLDCSLSGDNSTCLNTCSLGYSRCPRDGCMLAGPRKRQCVRNCTRLDSSVACIGTGSVFGECEWSAARNACEQNCSRFLFAECPTDICSRDFDASTCIAIPPTTEAPTTATTVAPTTTQPDSQSNPPTTEGDTNVTGTSGVGTPEPTPSGSPVPETTAPPAATSDINASLVLAGSHWAGALSANQSAIEATFAADLAQYVGMDAVAVEVTDMAEDGGLSVTFMVRGATNATNIVEQLLSIGTASPQSAFPATLSRYEASSAGAAAEVRVLSSAAAAVIVPPAPTEAPPGEQTLLEGSSLSAGAVLLIILAVFVVVAIFGVVGFGVANGGIAALGLKSRRHRRYGQVDDGDDGSGFDDDGEGDVELTHGGGSNVTLVVGTLEGYSPVSLPVGQRDGLDELDELAELDPLELPPLDDEQQAPEEGPIATSEDGEEHDV